MKKLLLILLIAAAAFVAWKLYTPPSSFRAAIVEFPRGTPTRIMADRLAEAGVIDRAEWFLLARALRPSTVLKAGEYQFDKPLSVDAVLDKIARGDVLLHAIVVPEGSNIFDISRAVGAAGFGSVAEFLAEVRQDEGKLFPATYRFAKGTSLRQIADAMRRRFQAAWAELGASGNQNEILTLASLVEKEARVPEERPVIASVYWNRLRSGMRMDCDPTVIYAALLEGVYRGAIFRSDLERDHPYNTYRRTGLPPGPIANPGMESLRAAVHPADTNYLFFVAKPDGSGRHVFSRSIGDHNRAVLEYRNGQQRILDKAGASATVSP